MVRKVPCQYCKIRRRKCERSNETKPCLRCIRNKRDCVPQGCVSISSSSSEEEEEIDKERYIELCQQVEELQLGLVKLEKELNTEKSAKMIAKQEPIWDLRFENGKLMLGTKINDFNDIEIYKKTYIRYLSPFGPTTQSSRIVFEQAEPGLLQKIVAVMAKLNPPEKERKKSSYENSLVTKCLHPEIYMEKLINTYFHCINSVLPILHENTFRKRYAALKNKAEDPITLAICATASVLTCLHSDLESQEKRYFGEYFFNKCMKKLVSMFDEPESYVESIIIINCLQGFMLTTLRLNECKKWATIAALLASNLKQMYPDYKNGSLQKNYAIRVFYATIHRNCIAANITLWIIEFCMDGRIDSFETFKDQADVLPDESPFIQDLIRLANCLERLESHPVMMNIFKKAQVAFIGQSVDWTFEDIVRFEDLMIGWWKKLPENFKLCEEPFDCTKEMIQNCSDTHKLLTCLYVHSITVNIQVKFIKPKISNNAHHQMVGEKAVHLAIYATEIISLLTKQLESINRFCFSPSRVLMRSMDALMSVMNLKDTTLALKTKIRIKECMDEFKKSILPDHHITSNTALPSSVSWKNVEFKLPISELYQLYPLPCEALIYDVVHTSVMDLTNL